MRDKNLEHIRVIIDVQVENRVLQMEPWWEFDETVVVCVFKEAYKWS